MAPSRRLLPIAIGTCFFVSPVSAQDPRAQDSPADAVVVTATRTPQRASRLTSDVTVISREAIEQAGQSSLVQVLQSQPGLQVTSNGGLGSAASVFLRGTNSDHVLVLLDGLRMGSATLGTTAFQNIPPGQIERIEILRGPASALYGADAIGGVIQIFTRAPEGAPRPRGSAGYGSYRTGEYSAGYGGTVEDTSFNVNAGHLASRSFSATRPASTSFNPDRDPYRNTSLSARLAHRLSVNHELGATFFGSEGRTHFDAFPAAFDHFLDQTLAAWGLYSRNRFTPAWTSTLRIGRGLDDTTAVSGATPSVFKTEQGQATWQNDVRTPLGELLLAAEYLNQKVTSTTNYPVKERTIRSLAAGYTGHYGAHTLQANLREDDNSQFGDRTTGSLGYGYAIAPGWRLSAGYGTAFKAPSFNQLYFPGFGNPNLRPESARNGEAALRYDGRAHSAGLVAYRNRVRDLIVNVSVPGTGLVRPANVNRAEIKGVTLTYGYSADGWSVRANADFLDPRDEASGRLLPRRAKRHGALALARESGPWSAGVELFASGYRYDDTANTRRLGGYALANLFAAYRLTPSWSLLARVNNVFDKEYELVRTFATPRRNAFVALRYEAL
jgi:vitamin B12 transporter